MHREYLHEFKACTARRKLLLMHLPDREPLPSVQCFIRLAAGHSHGRLRCLQVLIALEVLVERPPLVFTGSIPQSHQRRMSCCSRTAGDTIQDIPLLLVSLGRRQLTCRHLCGSLGLCSSIGQISRSSFGSRDCRGRHRFQRSRFRTSSRLRSLLSLLKLWLQASPILNIILYI